MAQDIGRLASLSELYPAFYGNAGFTAGNEHQLGGGI